MKLPWVALFAAVLLLVAPARAHTRSETHSNWQISGRIVRLAFTVPLPEAKRLAPPGTALPSVGAVGAYLARHVGASAGSKPCPAIGAPEAMDAVQGVLRFEFRFDCPSAERIAVHSSAFFDLVPSHTNFAQIQTADGSFIEQLITADSQTLGASPDSASPLQNASFLRYVTLGIMHIFTGVDHQAFLVGLILLSRRVRDLAFVITGFTLGHSATLALALTGVLRPHAEFIDALIGLTIALVGAENLAQSSRRPGLVIAAMLALLAAMTVGGWLGFGGLPSLILIGGGLIGASYLGVAGQLADAARLRILVTLVFGLVHGFGFAADLLEMKLPKARLGELLVGFNMGVEIGQLTIVLLVTGAVALLVRLHLAVPRAIAVNVGTAALIAVGLFWFVSRSYA